MNEKNFDWNDLKLFLAVARAGGLSGAMESSGKSAPTLSRRMHELEERIGAELFIRMPRGYELTPKGLSLLNKLEKFEPEIISLEQNPDSR